MRGIARIIIGTLVIIGLTGSSCEKQPQGYVIDPPDPPKPPVEQPDEPNKPNGPISPYIYSISVGPGEDASSSMTVSWAVDAGASGASPAKAGEAAAAGAASTYVLYAPLADESWAEAQRVAPEQSYSCDVFDGIWSKDADGNDINESARFTKCGATLAGLKPDTDYKYVVVSEDGSQSRTGQFRTAGATDWSCCVISDFHSYTPLPKRLKNAMGMIDTIQALDPSLDWILSPGDVVAWGGSYSFWKRFFEEDNTSELMWARANGNHDNWTREANEVTKEYDIPNDFFKGTSYYPQNGYGDELGVCYHFRYGNALFVVLNTEDMDDGAEFKAAVAWLKDVVQKARSGSNPPKFVVVCQHYEWFYGTDGKTSEYGRWYTVFDQVGVDLAIAGNNHVYLRSHPLAGGKVSTSGRGTVYLQTPASDNDRGRSIEDGTPKNADLIAFRWSEGSHSVGAVRMSVKGTRMTLDLLDRSGIVLDSTTIFAR